MELKMNYLLGDIKLSVTNSTLTIGHKEYKFLNRTSLSPDQEKIFDQNYHLGEQYALISASIGGDCVHATIFDRLLRGKSIPPGMIVENEYLLIGKIREKLPSDYIGAICDSLENKLDDRTLRDYMWNKEIVEKMVKILGEHKLEFDLILTRDNLLKERKNIDCNAFQRLAKKYGRSKVISKIESIIKYDKDFNTGRKTVSQTCWTCDARAKAKDSDYINFILPNIRICSQECFEHLKAEFARSKMELQWWNNWDKCWMVYAEYD